MPVNTHCLTARDEGSAFIEVGPSTLNEPEVRAVNKKSHCPAKEIDRRHKIRVKNGDEFGIGEI